MEQATFLLGKIQDWHILLIAVVFLTAIFVRKFYGREEEEGKEEEEKENPEIIAKIEKARSAEELMGIVDDCGYFVGRENDVFLKNVLRFGLCGHYWVDVYAAAAESSELERVAKEKVGSELSRRN